jgi:glycosyltransferase involved in cell wall biosynthesis
VLNSAIFQVEYFDNDPNISLKQVSASNASYNLPMNFPKISVITPSFNQAAYLEETIQSVLSQNYPNLEYIIIDGGSTDGSVDIIKKYADRLHYWVSEPDGGMYEAIQKGFAQSTGDMMGWLNSDDMLHKNALFSISELLSLPGVEWIQGQATFYDEQGRTVHIRPVESWNRLRYLQNDYEWIQQESTYWTRELWEKAGGYVSVSYKYAGDLELWNRFFQHAKLYTPNCLIGGYRMRTSDQLSLEGMEKYHAEAKSILEKNIISDEEKNRLRQIRKSEKHLRLIYKTKVLRINYFTKKLLQNIEDHYEYPGGIKYSRMEQKFVLLGEG